MNQYVREAWAAGWGRFAVAAALMVTAAVLLAIFWGHTAIVMSSLAVCLVLAAAPFWSAGLFRSGEQTIGAGSERAEECARESKERQAAWLKGQRYKSETPLQ